MLILNIIRCLGNNKFANLVYSKMSRCLFIIPCAFLLKTFSSLCWQYQLVTGSTGYLQVCSFVTATGKNSTVLCSKRSLELGRSKGEPLIAYWACTPENLKYYGLFLYYVRFYCLLFKFYPKKENLIFFRKNFNKNFNCLWYCIGAKPRLLFWWRLV